jgi:hypothetical protein
MNISDWMSDGIAVAALGISGVTAALTWRWRVRDRGCADMTAYFHRNSEMAKVVVGDKVHLVGYNVVLWNRGPAAAAEVSFRAFDGCGNPLHLVDLDENELPLSRLEAGARYPVPWLLATENPGRHFQCSLSWGDPNGRHSIMLPLRRGETSQ